MIQLFALRIRLLGRKLTAADPYQQPLASRDCPENQPLVAWTRPGRPPLVRIGSARRGPSAVFEDCRPGGDDILAGRFCGTCPASMTYQHLRDPLALPSG